MFRIAIGRAEGIACFGGTVQAFLASLAPLIAFPLVGAGFGLFTEGPRRALTDLAMTLCAVLTPAVLSFEIARRWNRREAWLRYATAFNWCEWILPVLAVFAMLPMSIAVGAGASQGIVAAGFVLFLGFYALWLHWFLARNALSLSGLRAVLLVLLVNAGTAAAVLIPGLLAPDRG
ncbi:hypothetical protein [Rhodopila sp.]|uniref:hypothetical protein n=1 Tax=Rhodopila sp. TaxID=2480087 RepID=UPI002C98A712|nr:hypothetical protein [Rhodopila sp.]HVZ09067.1 hypothetical protein [Rhodopila sp.]